MEKPEILLNLLLSRNNKTYGITFFNQKVKGNTES